MNKLNFEFYNRATICVAKELLGKLLVRSHKKQLYVGRIVEVEAYLGAHDLAAHSSKGVTQRTQVMFGPPGHAYVYLIYGLHHCLNVVTEQEGHGSAVLLRAIEPIQNIEVNTKGPGLLCKALHIDKSLNGWSLDHPELFIASDKEPCTFEIVKTARVGVAYAKEWALKPLRFYIKDNPYVSKKR